MQDFLQLPDKLIDRLPKRWRPGPGTEDRSIHLLNAVCLIIIWRTVLNVKRRIYQLTEHQTQRMYTETTSAISEFKDLKKYIKVLRQQLKEYKRNVATAKLENKELKVV
ncbi:hypothetical protein SKAU_G00397920 [Synaphobranchus kaupii]|uniref:Uncharacterized protein n=1 Tax=Synaphobranchus kaupii TaxID=118154 RepID=A0A9Q1IA40_SYNKA|nr:hypothetical protein SKAU_G00397920 [Synaphobranchus kaupii]